MGAVNRLFPISELWMSEQSALVREEGCLVSEADCRSSTVFFTPPYHGSRLALYPKHLSILDTPGQFLAPCLCCHVLFYKKKSNNSCYFVFHNLLFMMYLSVLFRTEFCKGWEGYLRGRVLGKGMGMQHFYEVLLFASTLYCSEMANAI